MAGLNRRVALVLCQWPDGGSVEFPIWNVPLTTPLLADRLREAGWEVHLFDTRLAPHGGRRDVEPIVNPMVEAILAIQPAVVGFSFLSPSAVMAQSIAKRIRELNPSVALLAGGTHCTVAPHLFTDCYDLIVRGEGEEIIGDVVGRLASGERPVERVIRSESADLAKSRTVVGADWAPYQSVQQKMIPHPKAVFLELGRGCPFRCTFCEIANKDNFPATRRARPMSNVIEEATRWRHDYESGYYLLVDSIATTAPGFIETFSQLCRVLDRDDFVIHLNSAFTVFSEPVARAIAQHRGPVVVFFGLETASAQLGPAILKGKFQLDAVNRALDLCDKYSIDVGLNVIFGFAGETNADRAATLDFLEQRKVKIPNPNILNPLPGTPIYQDYLSQGRLRQPNDLSIWMSDRIREEKQGPVLDVNYNDVLTAYEIAKSFGGPDRRAWPEWRSTPAATPDC